MGIDPISLTMMGMAVAGGAIAAKSKMDAGAASSANAAYQAQVAENNAKVAEQNAELETQSGEIQASNYGLKTRAKVGATTAQQGASGIDLNVGSSVDVRTGEAELGALDALTIRSNAARRAYGYTVAATGDRAQGGLLDTESKQIKAAAPWQAAASLLSSASSVGSKFAGWQNANPGGGSVPGDPEGMT